MKAKRTDASGKSVSFNKAGKFKKKSKGKANDDVFGKKRVKLGRSVPKANSTNTSFKASTLSVPTQSVCEDKDGEAVNSRNLTLLDLIGQTGHFNPKKQRDALMGMKDLFTRHPEEISSNLNVIFSTLSPMIVRDDIVRKSLCELMHFLLPPLSKRELSSFINILRIHLRSGLSHVVEEIRMDSLKIIDVLIASHPYVASSFLKEMLSHYLHLLCGIDPNAVDAATDAATPLAPLTPLKSPKPSRASLSAQKSSRLRLRTVTAEQRADVLESILSFLKSVAITDAAMDIKREAAEVAEMEWADGASVSLGLFRDNIFEREKSQHQADLDNFAEICLPLLVDVWVESGVASQQVGPQSFRCLHVCANLMRTLISMPTVRSQPWVADLTPLLQRFVAPYFPCRDTLSRSDPQVDNIDSSISAVLATVLRALKQHHPSDHSDEMGPALQETIISYITSRLLSLSSSLQQSSSAGDRRSSRASFGGDESAAESIGVLLPVVEEIIRNEITDRQNVMADDEYEGSVTEAFSLAFESKNISVAAAAPALMLMAHLTAESRTSRSENKFPKKVSSPLRRCVMCLGRMLFESSDSPTIVAEILKIILKLANAAGKDDPDSPGYVLLRSLAGSLAPFFFFRLKNQSCVAGPFVRLPYKLQTLTLDMLTTLPAWPESLSSTLSNLLSLHVLSPKISIHLLSVIQQREEVGLETFLHSTLVVVLPQGDRPAVAPEAKNKDLIKNLNIFLAASDVAGHLPALLLPSILEHAIFISLQAPATDLPKGVLEWGWLLLEFASGLVSAALTHASLSLQLSVPSPEGFYGDLARLAFRCAVVAAADGTGEQILSCPLLFVSPVLLAKIFEISIENFRERIDNMSAVRVVLSLIRSQKLAPFLSLCAPQLSTLFSLASTHAPTHTHMQQLATEIKVGRHSPFHPESSPSLQVLSAGGIVALQ